MILMLRNYQFQYCSVYEHTIYISFFLCTLMILGSVQLSMSIRSWCTGPVCRGRDVVKGEQHWEPQDGGAHRHHHVHSFMPSGPAVQNTGKLLVPAVRNTGRCLYAFWTVHCSLGYK